MAFVTGKTVPTVIDIAILAHTALGATLQLFVAGTALVTVCKQATVRAGAFGAARATHTAAILIPVVMVAKPALHAVFPGGVCRQRAGDDLKHQYQNENDAHQFFRKFTFHLRFSFLSVS